MAKTLATKEDPQIGAGDERGCYMQNRRPSIAEINCKPRLAKIAKCRFRVMQPGEIALFGCNDPAFVDGDYSFCQAIQIRNTG